MKIWVGFMKTNKITYDSSRIKGPTLSMEKLTRESLIRIYTQTVLVPIVGRVVFDSLRRRSSLVLLLQNKLRHPMMPSLGLSFSPLPAGDLVSRESQKTREFGVEEENFRS